VGKVMKIFYFMKRPLFLIVVSFCLFMLACLNANETRKGEIIDERGYKRIVTIVNLPPGIRTDTCVSVYRREDWSIGIVSYYPEDNTPVEYREGMNIHRYCATIIEQKDSTKAKP
jgi:hypothetical protein